MARVRSIVLAAAAAALAPLAGVAHADILAPGGAVSLGGTNGLHSPWLEGNSGPDVVRTVFIRDQSNAVVFSATVVALCVDVSPFPERYAMYRIVGINALGGRHVTKFELFGFNSDPYDVEYRADYHNLNMPSLAQRTPEGDAITFYFSGLHSNDDSAYVFVYTGARDVSFTGTARVTLNTGESVTVDGFPVPTPRVACEGDTNGDASINFADLNSVLSNFGAGCE